MDPQYLPGDELVSESSLGHGQFGLHSDLEPAIDASTPIHRMPTELLLKIFGHRVEEDSLSISSFFPYGSANPLKGPWPLSKVCHEWRNIVISTPSFWCYICVYGNYFTQRRKGILRPIEIQLERSRDTNLIIHLYLGDHMDSWNQEFPDYDLKALARMIVGHHRRWKEFTLHNDLPCSFYDEILLSGMSLPLSCPVLEYLDLIGRNRRLGNPWPQLFGAPPAPALDTASFTYSHPPPTFPWEQLRTLKISQLQSSFVHILPQLTRLENLTIGGCCSWPSSHSPRITLPKLETLVITFRGDCIANIVRSPALKNLSMGSIYTEGVLNQVIALVNRSSCSIETFSCAFHSGAVMEFERTLASMPALHTLSVTIFRGFPSGRRFQALVPLLERDCDGMAKYCPLLEHLSIAYDAKRDLLGRADPENISVLVDILDKRWRVGSQCEASGGIRLKRGELEAHFCGGSQGGLEAMDISNDDRLRLLALRDEGMELTLRSGGCPVTMLE